LISGVVVACKPEQIPEMTGTLNALPGIEVHHTDPAGRLVVTIEAANIEQSMERLREIQRLPHVLMAEMAEYTLEGEED
jgi:nitrate reductase NapD